MDIENEFDKRMELHKGRIPEHIRDALIDTTDTLDFCYSAVKSVFGELATPDHAIALCSIVARQYLLNRPDDTP